MSVAKNPLLRIEESYGKTRLIGWQFAADNQWDTAECFFFDTPESTVAQRIQAWLYRQATDDIAFEALFELTNGERFFLGLRPAHLDQAAKAQIIEKLFALSRKDDRIEKTFEDIRAVLGNACLAETAPERLELGVFAIWSKVKPLVVWRNGGPGVTSHLLTPDEMPSRSQKPDGGFPALHEPQIKPLMLDATWQATAENGRSFQYWGSLPVSIWDKKWERYVLSKPKYYRAVNILTDLPVPAE